MRVAVKELIALLRKQAAYVTLIADGSDSVILSSGFHVMQQPSPKHLAEFSVENGKNSGDVLVKHKAVKGAGAYIYQRANDPLPSIESEWAYIGFTTQRKYTDKGLFPGSKHWYRVAWITKDGLSAWSDPMMIVVL